MGQRALRNMVIALAALSTMSAGIALGDSGNAPASYLYSLSNFTGVEPLSWVGISIDESRDEVYVRLGGGVRIFNDKGMEIFRFNQDGELGFIYDASADDKGDIFAIVITGTGESELLRCNYRGDLISKIELKNVPEKFASFRPIRIVYRKDSLYLASLNDMQVIVTDREGFFKKSYDIPALIEMTKEEVADTGMTGFSVDQDGNMMFTVPTLAKVFVLSERGVGSFGRRGSTAGKFGLPAGIVRDATGKYLLVSDMLRCRILVFDSNNYRFKTEFGYRSLSPDGLVGPSALAVDSKNRLYVTQLRNKGVSVFQLAL